MHVIAPEIFEMRVLRELLPFILPEIDLDSVDVPDAMNIELSSIPSPVDSRKGSDLEETDPVRADNFYTYKEIEAAEALLFAVTDANKPSAPFILTMAGFCMMALENIHKKALELSSLQDPLQNRQDIH